MANKRTYEEYEPAVEWSRTAEADAVKLSLPGFRRDDIHVLVDNHRHLRTRGERPITGNRWSRFQKDFQLPANCNADDVRAKFENERLIITFPKMNTPSPLMPAPPRRPPNMAAVPKEAVRPTAPPPTVPAAPLAPAAPSVKPPAEPRPSMPRKPYAPVPAPAPAPAPEVEQPATTKHQSPLAAVQRPKEEEEKQRKREEEGKMAEDRKETMTQDQKATGQQQEETMPAGTAFANLQPRPASASRGLLVNVAVAVVVLLGITVYVWHSLRNATGGAGEHGHHRHPGAGSYRDEM